MALFILKRRNIWIKYIVTFQTIHELEDISNIDDIQTKLIICGMSGENKTFTKALFVGMAEADGMMHPKEMEIINQFFV